MNFFNNLFGKKNKQPVEEVEDTKGKVRRKIPGSMKDPGIPSADTIDFVPVAAIVPPFLMTTDGSFVVMMEIPPLDTGASNSSFSYWMDKYKSALSKVPPNTTMQISVIMEPADPHKDLSYWLEKMSFWREKSLDETLGEREVNACKSLAFSSDQMGSYIAQDVYDKFHPLTWRMIITLAWHPISNGPTNIRNLGITDSNSVFIDDITLQRMKAKAKVAFEVLSKQVDTVKHAFSGSGLPIRILTPQEMCQVVWRSLHPYSFGNKATSAEDAIVTMARGEKSTFKSAPKLEEFPDDISFDDIRDRLAPDNIIINNDCVVVDDVYIRGYCLYDFRPGQDVYIYRLSKLLGGWFGAMYLDFVAPENIIGSLDQRLTQVQGGIESRKMMGRISNPRDVTEWRTIENARADLQINNVVPIYMKFFVFRTANSIDELNSRCVDLESMLETLGVRYTKFNWNQSHLWRSVIPISNIEVDQKPRNMSFDSIYTFFWPPRRKVWDDNGIYVGVDEDTFLPVRIDFFGQRFEKTPSVLTIGRPGAGKSVTLRCAATAVLQDLNNTVFAIDLEGEMEVFTKLYGGRYINIGGRSSEKINVLDIPPETDAEERLRSGVEHLIAFVESVKGTQIKPGAEWNDLENAYRLAMIDRGFIDEEGNPTDKEWSHDAAPRLVDIVKLLEHIGSDSAKSIAQMLMPYATGVYKSNFNSATTFDISKERLVVFGMKDLYSGESSSNMDVYIWQVMGLIWGEVLRRHSVNPTGRIFVMIDEAHALLSHPNAAAWIDRFARRFRKRGALLWLATQQVAEFLSSPLGRTILGVVGNIFIMNQKEQVVKMVSEVFELSPSITKLLPELGTGHGILRTQSETVQLFIPTPPGWGIYGN